MRRLSDAATLSKGASKGGRHAWRLKGDIDKAIADFGEAVKLDGKLALAYTRRGDTWFEKHDYDRAIADLSEAIRYNPNDAQRKPIVIPRRAALSRAAARRRDFPGSPLGR